ncbi:hypothetical protein EJB05_20212 [Eragrostis curvula]|uniref:Uncharacterized protein n=1 Tax=Eragrostis curvula TaxID=38414 RepID=A0A5J9UY57_9POAL|nr:hypothetical protein EJB05_20212 [Eragrostis curvula]
MKRQCWLPMEDFMCSKRLLFNLSRGSNSRYICTQRLALFYAWSMVPPRVIELLLARSIPRSSLHANQILILVGKTGRQDTKNPLKL